MEIEMKYAVDGNETADKIWQDEYLRQMEEENSREELHMKAVYFDTEDYILSKNDIAMRFRMEGERLVATIKWGGKSDGAMHVRGEINVPLDDATMFLLPDIQIFKESDIGKEVIRLVGNAEISSIIETKFLRDRFRIDSGEGIMEVSIDRGEIITENGKTPICELEIELFSGEESALKAVAEKMEEKYGLKPETGSKYSKGLELLGLKTRD